MANENNSPDNQLTELKIFALFKIRVSFVRCLRLQVVNYFISFYLLQN